MVFIGRTPSQKLTTTQLAEIFPAIPWNSMVNERVRTSPPCIPVLNHNIWQLVLKITLKFALRIQLGFPSWLFPSGVTK